MLQEYSSGGNYLYGILFMAAYMLIQQGASFWAKGRTVLASSAIFFGMIFFGYLFDVWDVNEKLIGTIIGTSLLCVAYALNRSKHVAIAPFWYFVGAVLLLWSVCDTYHHQCNWPTDSISKMYSSKPADITQHRQRPDQQKRAATYISAQKDNQRG